MPEGGGGRYFVRIHKGTNLLLGLGDENNRLLRKKNHSPTPVYRMVRPLDECIIKLLKGLKTLKACDEFLISHLN